MSIYLFEGPEGDIKEIEYPIGQAPGLGDCIDISGVAYKRVLSTVQVDCIDVEGPKKSLPKWHPDAKTYAWDGTPVMKNQAEAKEWARKANARAGYDRWQWGEA